MIENRLMLASDSVLLILVTLYFSVIAMIQPAFQWSNQIAPNVLSCLYLLFMLEMRHEAEVRYSLREVSG